MYIIYMLVVGFLLGGGGEEGMEFFSFLVGLDLDLMSFM